jgi:hypothetical protein
MGSELVFGNFGEPDEERGLFARQSRSQRALQQRVERDAGRLLVSAKKQDLGSALRKRATENGMQDIADVGRLAQELASGDQFIAALLLPIAQEFTRQTVRDVRDFGREVGL